MPTDPVLGLIVPRKVEVPPEALAMYPTGVDFLVEALGLETMTPDGFAAVLPRIVPVAESLAARGAQAVLLIGTSLTFYRGAAFNESLAESICRATGLPCTTMSTAMVEALRAVGGRRLAVATAYNEEITGRLRAFLIQSGFEVLAAKGLGIERIGEAGKVSAEALQEFVTGVCHGAPGCDAMLISCGGFRTLERIAPLECECGVPIVSSMPHALWAGVRLLGLSGSASGFGALLSNVTVHPPPARTSPE